MLNCLYPSFRHWSDDGTIYVYSDPHFRDERVLKLRCNAVSDAEQIDRINSKVGSRDTLIILGDIGNPGDLRHLRGYKVVVLGNHDKGPTVYEQYAHEVYSGPVFVGDRLILSHEPIDFPWAFNIHGHEHGGPRMSDERHLNVCAEVIDYTPINLTHEIKHGLLSGVKNIHRFTTEQASRRKQLLQEI